METLTELLNDLDQQLQKLNKINYDKLERPLSPEVREKYFDQLNIKSDAFKELYQWKNGFSGWDNGGICQIMDMGAFLSLESISSEIKYFLSKGGTLWSNNFLPLIDDFSGDFLLFNNDVTGSEHGRLYLFSPQLSENPIPCYNSIYTLIKTTCEAYKQQIFVYDPKANFLDCNVKGYFKIAKSLNPESEYWGGGNLSK